jgi:hypothetical protein
MSNGNVESKATLAAISKVLSGIRWGTNQSDGYKCADQIDLGNLQKSWWCLEKKEEINCHKLIVQTFVKNILRQNPGWPLYSQLKLMMKKKDDQKRSVGAHVIAVIASINQLIDEDVGGTINKCGGPPNFDKETIFLARQVHNCCWAKGSIQNPETQDAIMVTRIFGVDDERVNWAKQFLRVAALYHDIGKVLSSDHHVTRGVHYMRDVNEEDRRLIESLFNNMWDRRSFWSVLEHHDIFGVLCTGEASMPSLADIVGWTAEGFADINAGQSTPVIISFLLWLNIADSNASLIKPLNGITTVEAERYLRDWSRVISWILTASKGGSYNLTRDKFKNMTLDLASRPHRTIQRISRLVSSCYRMNGKKVDNAVDEIITTLVEQELLALHGPRLQRFCYKLARFVKFDYALRFFSLLMKKELGRGKKNGASQEDVLKKAIAATCAILDRIVEEYGHLVDRDPLGSPRLGVDMSKLMNPSEIGDAICDSFKKSQARALRWIIDEIGVWLYGD